MQPSALLTLVFLAGMHFMNQPAAPDLELARHYDQYKETSITNRRIEHQQIARIVNQLEAPFNVAHAGSSVLGKEIYQVSIGEGPVKVLLWSQMHGDEPTATMAMMDIFRFFQADDHFNTLRRDLLNRLTLVFVPMLNPDGADCFQRHNALDIDLNRDAINLESPESRLLKSLQETIQPDWGFNLHDQNRYYSAGPGPNTATISFLAPAYNQQKEVNDTRLRAMQLIGALNNTLQQQIPNKVARYNDAFEPRAFGDNFQKWGTSTILIESGGLMDDPEKQEIRKLNFVILLSAFQQIASEAYRQQDAAAYDRIPYNVKSTFFDLIIHDIHIEQKDGSWEPMDLAFRHDMLPHEGKDVFFNAFLWGKGEFSDQNFAYQDFSGKGYEAVAGKIYPAVLPDLQALSVLPHQKLWRDGYTAVRVKDFLPEDPDQICLQELPEYITRGQLLEILPEEYEQPERISTGENAGLVIRKDGKIKYVVIKGVMYEV